MPRTICAAVLLCAAAAPADVIILDHIGDGSSLRDSLGNIYGYFNQCTVPPNSFGDRGVLEDFSLATRTRLTRIEAVVSSSPGETVNWTGVIGWRVEVYSNPQVGLNGNLEGDLYHAQVAQPTQLSTTFVPFLYGGNSLVLASFDVDVTLDPGMYWVAVIPVNSETNGYSVAIGSTLGNAFIPWQVLPGVTVFPLNQPGMAFRITGAEPCYANCDQSTAAPLLNVGDFTCFLTRFAGGDPYANCDASTAAPTLNVADFSCFLVKFAQGCP